MLDCTLDSISQPEMHFRLVEFILKMHFYVNQLREDGFNPYNLQHFGGNPNGLGNGLQNYFSSVQLRLPPPIYQDSLIGKTQGSYPCRCRFKSVS